MTERLLHSVPPGESLNKFYQSASVLGPLLFGEPVTESLLNRAASRPFGERRATSGRRTLVWFPQAPSFRSNANIVSLVRASLVRLWHIDEWQPVATFSMPELAEKRCHI